MRRAAVAVTLAASVCACGDDEAPAPPPDECAELRPTCLTDQMACVVGDDGPACEPCAVGEYADVDGVCKPIGGDALSHTFDENTTPPGGEKRVGICRSWTLNNDAPLYVNAVQLEQNEASHHSNWTYVTDDLFDGPDGFWLCADRDYSQAVAAISGGVLYAQSTQAAREVQKFPDGVVVKVPAHARIISDIHTLNTTSETVTGHMTVTIYSVPESAVTLTLTPFHLTYDGLDIPAQSTARFTAECALDAQFQVLSDAPFGEVEIYYLLPHTHALGTRMFVEVLGGPSDGASLLDVHGFNGEARGRQFRPPFSLAGATGLRFGCEFDNPRSENVGWGFGDQEMCEALGFADSAVLFESRVSEALPDGDENGMHKFTGDGSTLAVPYE